MAGAVADAQLDRNAALNPLDAAEVSVAVADSLSLHYVMPDNKRGGRYVYM
jgi:hypothetical protein